MENEANPVVKFMIGLVLVLFVGGVIIGIVTLMTKKAQSVGDEALAITDNLLETKYTQYDGESISGSNLLNLIKQSYADSEEMYICVKTTANTGGVFYVCDQSATRLPDTTQKTLVKDATTKSNSNYITPTKKFLGSVDRNTNGAIIGITFEQQ